MSKRTGCAVSDELIYLPPIVPVFPLPGVVLFPHTIIPLHIFEPRYREMIADALAGEHVIALALLKPGWEPLYHTRRAPIHSVIGIGRIMQSEQVADGNYNLLLRGIGRASIVEEYLDRASYRQARIEPVETFCSGDQHASGRLREQLFESIDDNGGVEENLRENWLRLRETSVGLGELVDLLSASLPADPELRQLLLGEADDLRRGEMLLAQFHVLSAMARTQRSAARPREHGLN